MFKKWEYATLEWLWDIQSLRWNLPNGIEERREGSYAEIVETLTQLGQEGWEVADCVAGGNWLFWTLKREI